MAEVVASAEPVAPSKGVRLTGAAVRGTSVFIDTAEIDRTARTPRPSRAPAWACLSRGIVVAHSGRIALRNAGPGCQFLIRPPRRSAAEP